MSGDADLKLDNYVSNQRDIGSSLCISNCRLFITVGVFEPCKQKNYISGRELRSKSQNDTVRQYDLATYPVQLRQAFGMKQAFQNKEWVAHENSIVHLKLSAKWRDENGEHIANQHIEKFNVWRDSGLLPDAIKKDILHQGVGCGRQHRFKPGELIPAWDPELLKTIPVKNFTGRLKNGEQVILRVGRFYPKGWFSGVKGIYSENMFPARVTNIENEFITIDYNHPLSRFEINLSIDIIDIFPPADEHGGRCSDAIDVLLANGPGMQFTENNNDTEFFVESAFSRIDQKNDNEFYQTVRPVHHLDSYARQTVAKLYAQFIKPESNVLDLMASWESHLPTKLSSVHLSCLGMNEQELSSNHDMNDYIVHDLNQNSTTPYTANSFDAVICTASVEYLINPLDVFNDIHRIVKPGGIFIVTFSNRFFPTKAISQWAEMHEFERVGLVMAYFRKSQWNNSVHSFSTRGRIRPEDDPHFDKTQVSDPVFAVWCYK